MFVEPAAHNPSVAGPFENGFCWVDANGKRVLFSAGDDPVDPLAESFASALRRDHIFSEPEETERLPPLFEDEAWDESEDDEVDGSNDSTKKNVDDPKVQGKTLFMTFKALYLLLLDG